MNTAVVTALIAAAVSLVVGLVGSLITVNLNRATAVKYLAEAAEKTGLENKRLNEKLKEARKSIVILVSALEEVITLLPIDDPHRSKLRNLADQARIDLD